MTAFIVPGDIKRQAEATLRHRGITLEDAVFCGTETHIVGGGQVSALDAGAASPTEIWLRSSFAVVYNRETNVASVSVPGMNLAYEFAAEES